jgi:hypothetical protein
VSLWDDCGAFVSSSARRRCTSRSG